MASVPSPRQRMAAALSLSRAVRLVWRTAPRWTAVNTVLVVVQGALPLAALYVMKRLFDAVSAGQDAWPWIAAAAGVALVTAAARLLGEWATEAQALEVTDGVAATLHAQSVAVDLAYYEDPAYYDTLHRAQAEAPFRPTRIVTGLAQIAQNGVALAGIAGWLVLLDWRIALLLALAVVPGALVRLAHARRLYGLQQSQTEQQRQAWYYHALLTEAESARELRLFHLGPLFQARYRDLRASLRSATLTLARHRVSAEFLGQVVAAASLTAFLAWVVTEAVRGAISVGDLAVYYLAFQTGLSLLQGLLRSIAGLYEDSLFLTHLYAFLDLAPTVVAPAAPVAVPQPLTRGLVFRDVTFRYPGRTTDALHGVSLIVAPGEVVALVGENGSGKTTLAKLACRLYDPSGGTVMADDVDLRRMDPEAWRRQVSVLFQDYVRYALTAGENIWLGDVAAEPDAARLAEAGRRAGAEAVVARLPKGYDTPLGHRFSGGQELSVGEWQRLALARAFWRDARLVILDEPSSALDPLAEDDLLGRFRALLAGRSALVISHRLSTARMADRICVLERGRLVESGTHAALLAAGGLYARMYRTQAGHYGT